MIGRGEFVSFRKFKNKAFDLKGRIVLAEPDNSGKSTLIQAVAMWNFLLKKWLAGRSISKAQIRTRVELVRRKFTTIPLMEMNRMKTMRKKLLLFLFCLIEFSAFSHGYPLDSLLTREEIHWLHLNGDKIRYAPNPSWPPGDFIDEDGIHKGIVSDYIRIFEEKLGISFRKVYFDNWQDIIEGLKSGDADFVGAIQKSPEREEFLEFTETFLDVPLVILVRDDYSGVLSGNQIRKMSLACPTGYTSLDFVSKTFPEAEIVPCKDDLTALLKTSLGVTDGTVVDLMTASYIVGKYGITNLGLAYELDFTWHLSFGCSKLQPQLCPVLNKILRTISAKERQAIYYKWVNIENLPEKSFVARNLKIILYSSILLFTLFIVILGISLILRRLVNKRTCELKNAKEKAEESERLKTAFLANMSHEVRTPMNGILGFADLLKEPGLPAEKREEYLKIIQQSGNYLLAVIDDIIEISKIDSGLVVPKYSAINVNEFFSEVFGQVTQMLPADKSLEMILKKDGSGHHFVITDALKLRQILDNLLTNAIKYTLQGSITLRYSVADNNSLEFSVEDTGIGIERKDQQVVFERFRQAEQGKQLINSGSGLGLAISKSYAELLGGSITLKSEPGIGSTFSVSLPVEVVSGDTEDIPVDP